LLRRDYKLLFIVVRSASAVPDGWMGNTKRM
jgi:hypothetical protein